MKMMKHNININLEKEATNIQKLPLKQLRKVVKNSVLLFKNNGEIQAPAEEDDILVEKEFVSAKIQKLSLRELRALRNKNSINLTEKVTITGLSQEVIQKLETQKEKATLEEIVTYCRSLHIPFKDFLPELFVQHV
jgi:DNA-binding Xre family transcriptional regulator